MQCTVHHSNSTETARGRQCTARAQITHTHTHTRTRTRTHTRTLSLSLLLSLSLSLSIINKANHPHSPNKSDSQQMGGHQVTKGIHIYGETGTPKQDNQFLSVCYVTTLSIPNII